MGALIAALVLLVPRLPSNAAAVGAGVACGGALGNLVSLLAWSQGVPDPFVVSVHAARARVQPRRSVRGHGDAVLLSVVVLHGTASDASVARERLGGSSSVETGLRGRDDRLFAAAANDLGDGKRKWDGDCNCETRPGQGEPGDHEYSHTEALPYRVVPQKPLIRTAASSSRLLLHRAGIGRSREVLHPSLA